MVSETIPELFVCDENRSDFIFSADCVKGVCVCVRVLPVVWVSQQQRLAACAGVRGRVASVDRWRYGVLLLRCDTRTPRQTW